MPQSPDVTRTGRAPGASEREADSAELNERIEMLEAGLRGLRAERERLATELLVAESWVKELALWLDEARTGGTALPPPTPPAEPVLSPHTVRLLDEARQRSLPWGKVARLVGLVALPWALIAGLGYLIYVLAA